MGLPCPFFIFKVETEANSNKGAMMNRQIQRILSILAHLGPQSFSFLHSSQGLEHSI